MLRDLKAVACAACGGVFAPEAMDFDHVRGEKYSNAWQMLTTSKRTLLAEIEKCELVCANCHRKRTQRRRLDATGTQIER